MTNPIPPESSRRSSLLIVICLVFAAIFGLVGFGVWGIRGALSRLNDLNKAVMIAHTWLGSNPTILQEIGTMTTALSGNSSEDLQDHPGHRTVQVRMDLTGTKSTGNVRVWLSRTPSTQWAVLGAVLATADGRTVRIGSPPDLSSAGAKGN